MKSRLVLRILWGLCCLLLLWMVVSDSIQFSKHPELYPIGCEGLGWSYESSENYIFTSRVAIGWSAIGFVASACYRFKYSGKNTVGTFCTDTTSMLLELYSHLWIGVCFIVPN